MRRPAPSEQYITIIDNKGREKIQAVEYIVLDARKEEIYVTNDGLVYAQDSLRFKQQFQVLAELAKLPSVLENPDLVIWDPVDPLKETLIYYKRLYFVRFQEHKVVAAIVKVRRGIKFFYNFFLQESGKVKGLPVVSAHEIEIWYVEPHVNVGQFGL